MEEDVMGPRQDAVGERYSVCNVCGRVFLREQAILTSDDEVEVAQSEQAEICPDCQRRMRSSDD